MLGLPGDLESRERQGSRRDRPPMRIQTGFFTRGRGVFAALLMVVLAAGLINPIGWAQDATPEIDSLDDICATLEASPDASPVIGTPEADTSGASIGSEAGTP